MESRIENEAMLSHTARGQSSAHATAATADGNARVESRPAEHTMYHFVGVLEFRDIRRMVC